MGPIAESITTKLTERFSPTHLAVEDDSHKHAGHAGAKAHAAEHGSGESHFKVEIESAAFAGMSRLQCHRAVMDTLSEEMKTVHALTLVAREP